MVIIKTIFIDISRPLCYSVDSSFIFWRKFLIMEIFNISDYITFAGIVGLAGLIFTQLNRVETNLKSDLSEIKSDLNELKEDVKQL